MKKHHHWVLIGVGIVILYHYRTQLLALWHTSVAPALAGVLPPSVAAVVGAGPHPSDIQLRIGPGTSLATREGGLRQAPGAPGNPRITLAVFDDPLEVTQIPLKGLGDL